MKKILLLVAVAIMIATSTQAQNQPTGMLVEVAEAETDHGDYSIFTYKDSDEEDSFGYYLSLGRVADFLGADEILGTEIKNLHEVTIRLGATTDEALATIGSILDLYDKDVDTTVEFRGRAATNGFQLGEAVTSTCVVVKKPLGGKRLQAREPRGMLIEIEGDGRFRPDDEIGACFRGLARQARMDLP